MVKNTFFATSSTETIVSRRLEPVLRAEWLGKALQKLLQRFESARDPRKTGVRFIRGVGNHQ